MKIDELLVIDIIMTVQSYFLSFTSLDGFTYGKQLLFLTVFCHFSVEIFQSKKARLGMEEKIQKNLITIHKLDYSLQWISAHSFLTEQNIYK